MGKHWKGMSREKYDHIMKHLHKLDLDLMNGVIMNRNAKALSNGYPQVRLGHMVVLQHQVFSVARWGEKCIGMSVSHKNKIRSDNGWENLELLTHEENLNNGEKALQPVKATNIESGEVRFFESQRKASQELGMQQGGISQVLSGKMKKYKGWAFERVV